jgi:hypothetical protein
MPNSSAWPGGSLERLSQLPDGRFAYEMKHPIGSKTHRVMDPMELMARLASIVAPPRYPLVRFFGLFAPGCRDRARRPRPRARARSLLRRACAARALAQRGVHRVLRHAPAHPGPGDRTHRATASRLDAGRNPNAVGHVDETLVRARLVVVSSEPIALRPRRGRAGRPRGASLPRERRSRPARCGPRAKPKGDPDLSMGPGAVRRRVRRARGA